MVSLSFSNVRFPVSALTEEYDLLLRVEAAFQLSVDSVEVLFEPNFSIVELRQWLSWWLQDGANSDFIYTSLEAEEEGLVTFRHSGESDCIVGSVWTHLDSEPSTSWDCVVAAARKYVDAVDQWVLRHMGIGVVEKLGDLR